MIKLFLLRVCVLVSTIFIVPISFAQSDPAMLVEKFLNLDYSGFRLSSVGHDEIWNLTNRDGEPPTLPIYVVAKYKVESVEIMENQQKKVRVSYNVIGKIEEYGNYIIYNNSEFIERDDFFVVCDSAKCLIDISFDNFKIPPRISLDSALVWIEKLIGMQKTESEKLRYIKMKQKFLDQRKSAYYYR